MVDWKVVWLESRKAYTKAWMTESFEAVVKALQWVRQMVEMTVSSSAGLLVESLVVWKVVVMAYSLELLRVDV